MSAYKMFIASIVFFAVFTGGATFQQDFFDNQGVESEVAQLLQEQYDTLNSRVDTLRQDVRAVSSPDTNVLDSAVAGLYLVPDFLGVLMSTITILSTTIDVVAAEYVFIPGLAATAVKTLITIVVSYSSFRLLIGLRG